MFQAHSAVKSQQSRSGGRRRSSGTGLTGSGRKSSIEPAFGEASLDSSSDTDDEGQGKNNKQSPGKTKSSETHNSSPSRSAEPQSQHQQPQQKHRHVGNNARYSLAQKLRDDKEFMGSSMELLERPGVSSRNVHQRKETFVGGDLAAAGTVNTAAHNSAANSALGEEGKKQSQEASSDPSKSPSQECDPAEKAIAASAAEPTVKSPVIDRRSSRAAQNWGKIRLANKMASAFKEVNEDLKKYGSSANDDHIDWVQVHDGDNRNGMFGGVKKPWWVIHPSSTKKTVWDIFMSVVLGYVAFYVPYRVCLYWDDDELTGILLAIEYFTDCVFGVDMLINFITAYYDPKTGKLIVEPKKIAKKYLKTYFFIDLLATFPFGLVLNNSAKTLNKTGKLARLPRLVKFLRLMRMLKLMRIYKLTQFITKVEHDFNIHHGVTKMVKIISVVVMVTHTVGCFWYFTGLMGGEDRIEGGWQYRYFVDGQPKIEQYVAALYWSFSTLTTVGYGDFSARTPAEQLYSMVMMLLGVSWYAYIVSSMSTIMSSFDRQNKAIREKMHCVNAFIHDAKLPSDMASTVRKFYEFAFNSNNKVLLSSSQYDADALLEELSSSLRAEVLLYVEKDLIAKIPFFKGKIPQFVADCITMFQPMVYQDGDFIIKEGSAADEMYFLIKGRASVYYGGKKQVTIVEGAYFGEIGCIMGGIRRAGIKAITVCELQALSRRNLNILLGEYPDVGEELKRIARDRIRTVKTSTQQQKQVAGIRKMLKAREKKMSLGGISEEAESLTPPRRHSPESNSRSIKLDKNLTKALTRSLRESTETAESLPGAINDDESPTAPGRGMQKAMSYRSSNVPSKQLSYRSAHLPMREMSMTSAFGAQGSGAGGMRGGEMGMANFVDDAHGRANNPGGPARHHSLTSSGHNGEKTNDLSSIVDLQVNDAGLIAQQSLEQRMEEITKAFLITRRQSVTNAGE